MISFYSGAVGSGKSYHAVELGLSWVGRGKHVIANFSITKPKTKFQFQEKAWIKKLDKWHFYDEITVERLMAMSIENGWFGKESQCLVIIDEAGIMFNSRDWQHARTSRTKWIKFLSQSRKFGYDFIFVTQSDRMVDKQIRGLVEYDVKHLKASNSFFLSWMKLFKITPFLYIYKWYQTKLKGNVRGSFYKPWIGNRYDTFKVFDLNDLVDSMKKVYDGKVIPASVLAQISVWEEEIKKELEKKEKEKEEMEKQLAKAE